MTFEEYLASKKIHSEKFREGDNGLWNEWKNLFEQLHPESFSAQKLFSVNAVRRRFPSSERKKRQP
ncbi:MAG: hypothetical protein CRN43_00520 [Candidatus Nephrothrix sp. EaCA]|nr:MAG: hypothetical protein CRN43_00520 [Candidatus Nephrothrix sp. EaCA]